MSLNRPLRPICKESLTNLKVWYPDDRWKIDPPDDLFEIALVVAGGQSAGCYLAGVLDFLFEALDCWQHEQSAQPDKTPSHRVKIKILVGASAGGLNAALAAVCARYSFAPASHTQLEDGNKNLSSPFYRAWVRDIDIANLLSTDDLKPEATQVSLLNTDYLERKVGDYIGFTGPAITRAWLDDPLPLKITVSNLEGVRYKVRFGANRTAPANASSLPMMLHRDHLAFLRPLTSHAAVPNIPDSDPLPLLNNNADPAWRRVGQTILATIAFPFALKQRNIERPSTDYDYRYVFPFAPEGLVYSPGFPGQDAQQRQFVTIDGGVMDNEPFELGHAALAGSVGTNKREGNLAKRAVILVDPFPTPEPPAAADGALSLPSFIGKFFSALVAQNRFKPIDLSLAEADDIYSRFMIAPSRRRADGSFVRGNDALASQPLRAFMGYMSESYRHHDFMLGRQNCYTFLRDWLVLPSDHDGSGHAPDGAAANNLFGNWPTAAKANPAFESHSSHCPGYRQIIPLTGTAAKDPGSYAWPAGKFAGYAAIKTKVEARLDGLYPRFRDQLIDGAVTNKIGRWFVKLGVNLYFRFSGRRMVLAAVEKAIDDARDEIDRS